MKQQLKIMVEELGVTEKSFKSDATAIVTMALKESKNNGYIASVLIFSMELDAYLTKNSSSWYERSMLIEILIPTVFPRIVVHAPVYETEAMVHAPKVSQECTFFTSKKSGRFVYKCMPL